MIREIGAVSMSAFAKGGLGRERYQPARRRRNGTTPSDASLTTVPRSS